MHTTDAIGSAARRPSDLLDSHAPDAVPGVRIHCGVDVVDVGDVREALERFGDRYRCRIFTDREIADACAPVRDVEARSLAARFAAKEAFMKALQARDPVPRWREIDVRRSDDGSCSLHLHGRALEAARAAGVRALTVSLTHEGDAAVAFVVALA